MQKVKLSETKKIYKQTANLSINVPLTEKNTTWANMSM